MNKTLMLYMLGMCLVYQTCIGCPSCYTNSLPVQAGLFDSKTWHPASCNCTCVDISPAGFCLRCGCLILYKPLGQTHETRRSLAFNFAALRGYKKIRIPRYCH